MEALITKLILIGFNFTLDFKDTITHHAQVAAYYEVEKTTYNRSETITSSLSAPYPERTANCKENLSLMALACSQERPPREFQFRSATTESHNQEKRTAKMDKSVISQLGWLVHGIRQAQQAFNILAHIPYELVIIDAELPGMSGIDFIRILLAERRVCGPNRGTRCLSGQKIKLGGRHLWIPIDLR
jgi:hypothetical protein